MISIINDDNFLLMAMKAYDNPHCKSLQEFEYDLARISYIKRHIKKYIRTKKIKERLLLNHIIIFCNVFGVEIGTRLLFSKIEEDMYPAIKTFLLFLDYFPKGTQLPEATKPLDGIPIDDNLQHLLDSIYNTV